MYAGTSRADPEGLPQHFPRVRPHPMPSRDVQCREVTAKLFVRALDNGVPRKGAVLELRGRSGLRH